MAVRTVRTVVQQQADGPPRGRVSQHAVADAEEVDAPGLGGLDLLVRVAVVKHRDGELLELGVQVQARLIENQQVFRVAVPPVGELPEKRFAADDRSVSRVVDGRRHQVRVTELQRAVEQPFQSRAAMAVHVDPVVPQDLGVGDQGLQGHELVAHRPLGPHAVGVDRLLAEVQHHAVGLLLRALPPHGLVNQILVIGRVAGNQDRTGADGRPVGRGDHHRPVAVDKLRRRLQQVVLNVLALLGAYRR